MSPQSSIPKRNTVIDKLEMDQETISCISAYHTMMASNGMRTPITPSRSIQSTKLPPLFELSPEHNYYTSTVPSTPITSTMPSASVTPIASAASSASSTPIFSATPVAFANDIDPVLAQLFANPVRAKLPALVQTPEIALKRARMAAWQAHMHIRKKTILEKL
jgi:hypothetical protein